MSHESGQTESAVSADSESRGLRPRRHWPIAVYILLAVAAYFLPDVLKLFGAQDWRSLAAPIAMTSFAAPAALIAMLRLPLRQRLKYLLALFALKQFCNLCDCGLSYVRLPALWLPQLESYELLRGSMLDLRNFASAVAIGHAVSSVTATFVDTRLPDQLDKRENVQGRIIDWLYFVTLVGFAFLPQLPEPRLTYNSNREIVFSVRESGLGPEDWLLGTIALTPAMSAAATGLFCLSSIRQWKLKSLMMALLGAQLSLSLTFVYNENFPLGIVIATFLLIGLAPVPYWILLRCAGYRAHSAREWKRAEMRMALRIAQTAEPQ